MTVTQPTYDAIQRDLDRIDPDHHYDVWIRAGIALFNYYAGQQEGLDVWEKWSRRGAKFEEGICQRRWTGFRDKEYTQNWWQFRVFARKTGALTVDD